MRGKETREQEEMVVGERSGARTEKKQEVWETVATRGDVKSMVLGSYDPSPEEWLARIFRNGFPQFGHKMSAPWLNGCWLVHVIAFVFRRKHEILPALTDAVEKWNRKCLRGETACRSLAFSGFRQERKSELTSWVFGWRSDKKEVWKYELGLMFYRLKDNNNNQSTIKKKKKKSLLVGEKSFALDLTINTSSKTF